MRAGQFGKVPLRRCRQTKQHAPLVRVVLDALDEAAFGQAIGKLDRGVVTKPQPVGQITDRDRASALVALDHEKRLMMSRRQAVSLRFVFAEFQKAADEKAKLGKGGVVRLGQSGSCQFACSFQPCSSILPNGLLDFIYIVMRYDRPAAQTRAFSMTTQDSAMASRHDDHRRLYDQRLGDFTTSPRVLVIGAVAVVVAIASVLAGIALLDLIRLVTNVAYFRRFSFAEADLTAAHLSVATVFIPVAGALIIGLMARFGSEKIRGHGIPEAIEAILLGRSRLDAKVAVLKPLSSAIAIGTGGPFGAEGPIIMTGGAIGSLIAQALPVSDTERKTLLVAGAAAGMTTVFGTPIAAIMLAVELLLFEWSPRSFIPVAVAAIVAEVARTALHMPSPLFPFHGEASITALDLGGWIGIGIAALERVLQTVQA